jgi:hypothetical protein
MKVNQLLRPVCAGIVVCGTLLTGCSKPGPLDVGTSTDTSASRLTALHTAAQCLRSHGVPNFADPVLGANGQVFTDARPLQDAPRGVLGGAMDGCKEQLRAASWNPETQAPAPASLIAAGVRSATCLRKNGLPNMKDPTASTNYTPGHGFGFSADELPPGADKLNPTVQHAFQACRGELDAEIAASALDKLSGQ